MNAATESDILKRDYLKTRLLPTGRLELAERMANNITCPTIRDAAQTDITAHKVGGGVSLDLFLMALNSTFQRSGK